MLKIIEAETSATPSRHWAEAVWRANPSIAPNWWRENLGFTHSKVLVDGRETPHAPLSEGVNAMLTHGEVGAWAQGIVRIAVTPNPTQAMGEVVVWQVPACVTREGAMEILQQLEQRVSQGEIAAYGLADADLGTPTQRWGLEVWLELAALAAEKIWGRKKRPAFKVVLIDFDAVASAPLFYPSTNLKGQWVPFLEHAAHLNLWVLAQPPSLLPGAPSAAALQALTGLAQAEAGLHQSLNGQWPHIVGQPVFMVLKALQQGQAPWPHVCMVPMWQQMVWPMLNQAFTAYGITPVGGTWVQAWREVYPYIKDLALAASAQTAQTLLQQRTAHVPEVLRALPWALQQVALVASVPGVGGVVVPAGLAVKPLLSLPDMADVGGFFTD